MYGEDNPKTSSKSIIVNIEFESYLTTCIYIIIVILVTCIFNFYCNCIIIFQIRNEQLQKECNLKGKGIYLLFFKLSVLISYNGDLLCDKCTLETHEILQYIFTTYVYILLTTASII